MYWWGVSAGVVHRWRRALGVTRTNNRGSGRLIRSAAAEEGAAAVAAREWTDAERAHRRRLSVELGLARHIVPGYHGPRWTAKELRLLGTLPDEEVARRTGRTPNAVRRKPELLGTSRVVARRRCHGGRSG
jgi:hypothetical protein